MNRLKGLPIIIGISLFAGCALHFPYPPPPPPIDIQNLSLNQNQLTVQGMGMDQIKSARLVDNASGTETPLSIVSTTNSTLIGTAVKAIALTSGKIYSLVVSDAMASQIVVSFSTEMSTVGTSLNTPLNFKTNGNVKMVLNQSGQLAIGTSTSARDYVEVQALGDVTQGEFAGHPLQLQTGTGSSDYALFMGADKTKQLSYLQSKKITTLTGSPLALNASGGSVLINTSDPATSTGYALGVNGSASFGNVVKIGATTSADQGISLAGGVAASAGLPNAVSAFSSVDTAFTASDPNILYLNTYRAANSTTDVAGFSGGTKITGSVGIGTTPISGYPLVLKNNFTAASFSAMFGTSPYNAQLILGHNSERLYLGSYYSSGQGSVGVIQASDFWGTPATDHPQSLLLNPNTATNAGRVGVGTLTNNAPLVSLDVGGQIGIHGSNNSANISVQGAVFGWNLSAGGGETDFINIKGLGTGGWNFYNVAVNSTDLTSTATTVATIAADGTYARTSDQRLKENIHPIQDALNKVLSLNGYTYYWRDPSRTRNRHIGVIAQEVEKVFPEAVHKEKSGYFMVSYEDLVAPLIAAVKEFYASWSSDSQELHEKVSSLETRTQKLEEENAKLKQENSEMNRRLERIEDLLRQKQKE